MSGPVAPPEDGAPRATVRPCSRTAPAHWHVDVGEFDAQFATEAEAIAEAERYNAVNPPGVAEVQNFAAVVQAMAQNSRSLTREERREFDRKAWGDVETACTICNGYGWYMRQHPRGGQHPNRCPNGCASTIEGNQPETTLSVYNPDTEALATLTAAVREWANSEDAITAHAPLYDSAAHEDTDVIDGLFRAHEAAAARLRSLVPSAAAVSLIEGEPRGPSIGGLCVEQADTKCPHEDHREFHCCVRPFGHAEKQHECKCGVRWPLEWEKPR